MIGIAYLMKYLFSENRKWTRLSLCALFIFFSLFTKQDGGALGFLICSGLLAYHCSYEKKWMPLLIFLISEIIIAFAVISPLMKFNFSYWFNHGQPPHTGRISIVEILDEFLYSSQWIKFYLVMTITLLFSKYKNIRELIKDKRNFVFLLLTIGILVEAAILQVTSYTPPDNNIFFHSFAFAFIFSALSEQANINLNQLRPLFITTCLLILWWSGVFWKYIQGPISGWLVNNQQQTKENIVNRHTYILSPASGEIPMSEWAYSNLKSFEKIRMPKATVSGIDRLLHMPIVNNNKNLRVLNMTELTPLTVEMPYRMETGPEHPLWYHLGVSMFNKEAESYEEKLKKDSFDLVLFEYIPTLNNFYPFRVRDTLLKYYNKVDSFPAPRRGTTQGEIEVFLK
jgi:hypothetical protein